MTKRQLKNNRRLRVWSFTLPLLFLLFMGSTAQAHLKVGYVDIEKALMETSEGKSVDDSLKKLVETKQKELKKKEDDVRQMANELERTKSVMSAQAFEEKRQAIGRVAQEKMLKLQEFARQSELEIQKKRDKLLNPLAQKMERVIDEIAKKEGYAFIFKKTPQSLLWAQKEANLTSKVVKEFEKKKKKKK